MVFDPSNETGRFSPVLIQVKNLLDVAISMLEPVRLQDARLKTDLVELTARLEEEML